MSEQSPTKARVEAWLDRSERPMLALAAFAVLIYLMELQGVWQRYDLFAAYETVALIVDLIFVTDVAVKVAVMGRRYLHSPWFVIDVISALPVLATMSAIANPMQGLRFVRGFRVFRVLRSLRSLRVLRSLPGLTPLRSRTSEDTPQRRAYERALIISVLAYSTLFVALLGWVRTHSVPGEVISIAGMQVPAQVELQVRDGSGESSVVLAAEHVFNDAAEVEFYLVFGSLLGMLLLMVVIRFQIPDISSQQMRELLNVALPVQVAEHFMKHPESYNRTVRMPATVIFCDITGFTATVEKLGGDLDTLKDNLEASMDAVVEVHRKHDLIVDKFIGDAIMSFRGGNLVSGDAADHARRVVRAILGGDKALSELDNPYFRHMKVGCASANAALIGTFGTSNRLSYTALGDRVNLAARLEGSCNAMGVTNLICDVTRDLCADLEGVHWRRVGTLRVQGKQEPMAVWEVMEAPPGVSEPVWIAPFHEALSAWQQGDLKAAVAGFRAVDELRAKGDGPSKVYLKRAADEFADSLPDSPPEGWDPVLQTKK